MVRKNNWEFEFVKVMEEARIQPFEWGKNDCGLLVCRVIKALTDVDIEKEFLGKYSTEKGALKALKKFSSNGLLSVGEEIAANHGFKSIFPRIAQRGDVVVCEVEAVRYFGVCIGEKIAVVSEINHFALYSIDTVIAAWRIE